MSTRALLLSEPVGSPQITPWQQLTVQPGDSLSRVFIRAGLGRRDWQALLKLDHTARLRHLHPGDTLDIRKTPDGHLAELRFPLDALDTLKINRSDGRLVSSISRIATQTRQIIASGTVQGSLSKSLADANVPSTVANKLASIYRYRHNLSRHMHSGDRFAVIYRALYSNGQEVSTGPVIAASITTAKHSYKAFLARSITGKANYYDARGHSYAPAFSRHPVAYTRISSPFNLHRMNPVLHIVRPHEGVDMAAPMGTPIHAAAAGTVKYAAWMHGYGRLVELRNMDGYSTRYAHMHRIRHGLNAGDHVSKGEIIGYVGESGEATGPHLHFEIRRNGVPHDPLTVALPNGAPLPKSQLAAYSRRIQPLIARLNPASRTLVARNARAPATGDSCTRAVSLNATLAIDPVGAAQREAPSNIFCVVPHRPASA